MEIDDEEELAQKDVKKIKETVPKRKARKSFTRKTPTPNIPEIPTKEEEISKRKSRRATSQKSINYKSTLTKRKKQTTLIDTNSVLSSFVGVLDSTPEVTRKCQHQLKSIILTAVELQRHSRRQKLTSADFKKALMIHKVYTECEDTDWQEKNRNEVIEDINACDTLFCSGKPLS